MTKKSDVSWIPKPVGCSLKRFTTDELVAELKGRHELCPVVDEMTREPVCLFVMTTESLVKELSKRDNVTKYPRWVTSEEVFGHRQTLDGKNYKGEKRKMSVMVINPETYGRIAKMLVSPGRVYEDLSRAVYTYRDQLVSRGQFGGKDDEDTRTRFIVSWMERVYVANQMAYIFNYRDEEQTISFLEESHLKFNPMSMKAMYEELEGIEYNLYTGAARTFLSEEDMTRLQTLKALVAKEIIRGAPKMNIPECRDEADLVFHNMD